MAQQNLDGTKFFDCVGPNSKYVELVSKEGEQFFLKRKYALLSPKIEELLNGPGELTETSTNKITFRDISSVILVEVCRYLKFNAKYSGRIRGFTVPRFNVKMEIALELLMTARFLQC